MPLQNFSGGLGSVNIPASAFNIFVSCRGGSGGSGGGDEGGGGGGGGPGRNGNLRLPD